MLEENVVAVKVYLERGLMDNIASLEAHSTFYIVDPGRTKDSCSANFQPKLILLHLPMRGIGGGENFSS